MNDRIFLKSFAIVILPIFGLLTSFVGLAKAATVPIAGQIENISQAKLVSGQEDQATLATGTELLIPLAAPVTATNDSGVGFITNEDNSFTTGDVLANDTGATSVDSFDDSATLGTVSDNGDGTFYYDPNGQFESLAVGESAEDTFVYTATDGVDFDTAVVTITINGVNDGPTANDDNGVGFTTDEDSSFTTGNVLDNDDDPDATDTLSVQSIDTSGTVGQVINLGDGTFTYNPNGKFESLAVGESTTDTFEYTVSDGNTGTNVATVTATIDGVNDDPTDISLSNSDVDENLPSGTFVGTFSTTDPDSNDSHTYTLVDAVPCNNNNNSSFKIVGSDLQTAKKLDVPKPGPPTLIACVQTDDDNGGTFVKQFTITVNDVFPSISVTKTADPDEVPEPGGNVNFTIQVSNTSQEDAIFTLFIDDQFDLSTLCTNPVGTLLKAGDDYVCNFTAPISGNAGDVHENRVTAEVIDNESNRDLVWRVPERVDITDVLPDISVSKTANPLAVTEPGGNVTFTILVTNNSSAEAVSLESLTDNRFGDLNGKGNCVANGTKTIAPSGGTYSCSFTKFIAGVKGDPDHVNNVTAEAKDDEGNSAFAQDSASVIIGKLSQVYVPLLFMPEPTELFVKNTTTGNVTFILRDLLTTSEVTRCTVPTGQKKPCDHDNDGSNFFSPGTYEVKVTASCGSSTFLVTYKSGQQTTEVFCN